MEIIKFLVDNFDNGREGWVRAREVKDGLKIQSLYPGSLEDSKKPMCSDHTLSRLLKVLTSEEIIERHGEERTNQRDRPYGQDPVYYRINPLFGSKVPTEYGLKKENQRLYRENIKLSNNLELAKSILDEHGFMPEYNGRAAYRQKRSEERKHLTRDEKLGKILHLTPEQVKERNRKLALSQKRIFKEDLKKLEGK